MQVDKKEAALLERSIRTWQEEGVIDAATADRMRNSYTAGATDPHVLSTYALIASVSCGLLAFGALVMDEKWVELIRRRLGLSEVLIGVCFVLLSGLLAFFSHRRLRKTPAMTAANESFNITIVLSLAVAMAYIGRSIGYQEGNYAPILLVAALLYGAAGVLLRSQLLWTTMLLALAGWWGAQTYAWSAGADYWLGMNYALRMTLFGVLVLLLYGLTTQLRLLQPFTRISQVMGVLFFLVAAWSLSVIGNSSSLEVWWDIRQGRLWYWALGFSLMLVALIVYAFRTRNAFLRDTAMIFFLVNIYTRYFEYFWDKTNKGLFFAILAFSFWWIGKAAEKWRKKRLLHERTP